MSTLLPTSAPHTFDSCTQICMTLHCPHVCPSHPPLLWSHTLIRMCTCISTCIHVHLTLCLLHSLCIATCKHVCPHVALSVCCIHPSSCPTPGLECVPASVHECMSIVVTFKKVKYIKDILVRAKISKGKKGSQFQFNMPKTSQYCTRISHNGNVNRHGTTHSFCTMMYGNCKSSNLKYCLECNIYNIKYVGQTKNRIINRFWDHLFNIRS